jgi:hypothetical protein
VFLFRIFRVKNFISTVCALALSGVFVIGLYVKRVVKFEDLQGERVFYLDSASSQGLLKDKISWLDFPRVRGESVRYSRQEQTSNEEILRSIVEKYHATVLFSEEVDGVVSYYCYTDEWTDHVRVEDKKVNLHVAISTAQCVVGAPIIFGGF